MNFLPFLLFLLLCSTGASCSDSTSTPAVPIPVYTYEVIRVLPHDRGAFTQGLLFADGFFYESTGLYGASSLRQVEPETGIVRRMRLLDRRYFGEGLALFEGRLIQLTWRSQTGWVYDQESFARLDQFSYPTEGWGLTHDGERLIMSDGTEVLYFLDPHTFAEIGQLRVHDNRGPVTWLNELEYVEGEIYANVWQSDRIARICPATGQVTGWIDLTGLLPPEDRDPPVDVLNGIAYDAVGRRLFVTGKRWPKIFQIELVLQG